MNTKDITNKKKIVIFSPYPYHGAPSQRFRYEQYIDILQFKGYTIQYFSFLDSHTNSILYKPGYTLSKTIGVVKGFLRRFLHILKAQTADFVFVHREASPIGPPIFEWILTKLLRKKVIYDFDDAIWIPNTSGVNRIVQKVKWSQKVSKICGWSYKVSCGNPYLCQFASQYNNQVYLNPTTIDTENLHNQIKSQDTDELPVIGWTGSHSTMQFLDDIVPVLKNLGKKHNFKIIIISNKEPDLDLDNLEFISWNAKTEIPDLLKLHIGIMPLTDDQWAQGKCGFKALQYLSLGIPAVVSPVGVNTQIVTEGVEGYQCQSPEEWEKALEKLIIEKSLRIRMGKAGRKKIVDHFSVQSNTENFIGLFT